MPYARFSKPAQDAAGNLLTGIWCEVRREDVAGNPLEPLFSDRMGDVGLSNPFYTADGVPVFFAAGGSFRLRYYKTGYDHTERYVGVGLAAESDLQGFVPMGAWDSLSTYDIGDMVTRPNGGTLYLFASKVSDNLNNAPNAVGPADSAFWVYLGVAVAGPAGPAGVIGNWRRQWVTAAAYALNDSVQFEGSAYIALVSHTAGTFLTDLAAGKWDLAVSSGAAIVASRAELKAIDTTRKTVATLTEAGRAGTFLWMPANYATLVTADPYEGVYIKANAIATSAGAWVRVVANAFNVKWFGAAGDGLTTGDAAKINAAITLAYAHTGGRNVYLPAGNYSLDSQISIPKTAGKSCKFFGDGTNSTTLTIAAALSTTAGAIAIGSGVSAAGCDISVEGLTVTGANTKKAFYLTNANICQFKHVECRSVAIGVQLETSYFVQFDQCEFDSCATYGIVSTTTAHGLRVENCGLYAVTGQGIYLSGASASDNVVITGNDFENTTTPIQFDPGVHGLLFTGNYVEFATGALWNFAATSTGVVIEGNWLAFSASTALNNLVGGRFAANSLYDQAVTVGTITDFFNGGGNLLGGTSTLGALPKVGATGSRLSLNVAGAKVADFERRASSVNYPTFSASETTVPIIINAEGTDTNIGWLLSSKGNGSIFLKGNSLSQNLLLLNGSTASVNYAYLTPGNTGSGVTFGADGTDTNIDLVLAPKGTGRVTSIKGIVSTGGGVGYATGAGGAITQATSRTTAVTLNKASGAVTLVSAAGSATFASFTVNNSVVEATDTIIVSQKSGADLYEIHVTAVAAGSFRISFRTTGGTTTEQPVFNFAVIKAVAA